jgi:hypothetical protein
MYIASCQKKFSDDLYEADFHFFLAKGILLIVLPPDWLLMAVFKDNIIVGTFPSKNPPLNCSFCSFYMITKNMQTMPLILEHPLAAWLFVAPQTLQLPTTRPVPRACFQIILQIIDITLGLFFIQ